MPPTEPTERSVEHPQKTTHTFTTTPGISSFFQRRTMLTFVAIFALLGGVIALAVSDAATGQASIASRAMANKCLDNTNNLKVSSNPVRLHNCNNTDAQKWTISKQGTIVNANGFCLDVVDGSKKLQAFIQLNVCNGSASQQWHVTERGVIINSNARLCLDNKSADAASDSVARLLPCDNSTAQKWITTY